MDRKKKKCSFGKNRMGAIQSRIESTSSNSTTIGEMLADSTFDLHLLSNKDSKVWVRDIRRQVGLCPYWLNRDPCWSVRSRLVVPFSFCFRLSLEATGTLIPFFLLLFIKLQPPLFLSLSSVSFARLLANSQVDSPTKADCSFSCFFLPAGVSRSGIEDRLAPTRLAIRRRCLWIWRANRPATGLASVRRPAVSYCPDGKRRTLRQTQRQEQTTTKNTLVFSTWSSILDEK